MTPADQAVEALASGRQMSRKAAVALLRSVEAGALREEADRLDGLHVGLMSTWGATTLIRQRAADIAPEPVGGAA
jgi:hypothetical protein